MELYVLRHAIAADHASTGRDADRALTPEGRAKLQQIVKAFGPLEVKVDRVLSSPYVRARETAEAAGAALGVEPEIVPDFASGASPARMVAALQERIETSRSASSRVMVVGHEPDLGCLVTFLMSGDDQGGVRMKKAGLVKLSIGRLHPGRCAVLEWSLWPRHMVALSTG